MKFAMRKMPLLFGSTDARLSKDYSVVGPPL